MNVTEFKARIKEIEANQNVHYKIVYKEFKDALEQKKRHSFWHDSPKLAEITNANKEKIEFFVEGNLNADVCSETGDTIASFKNYLSPIEGILETDNDVHRLESMDDGDYMLVNSANYVVAVYKDKKIRFKDPDIVNCIFDEEKIASIFSESQDIPEPKKEAEPEKEEIPEPVFKEEPSEEPVQEKVPKKEANPEKTVSSEKKVEIASEGRCDLLPLDIVSEFFDAKSEGKSELEEMAEYQKDNDYKHLIRAAVTLASKAYDDPETAILDYAVYMEENAAANGEYAWQHETDPGKFVDQTVRHLIKYRRGDTDEKHDRAFIGSCLCGAWTIKNK